MNIDLLRELIEQELLTHEAVAKKFGVQSQTISKWCKRFGIKSQRTGPRNGSGHPDWNGGVRIVGGYRYIYSPYHPYKTSHKVVLEHRLVMEQKIGRYLLPGEVVHHIDGDRLNNHPDNLVLFSKNADHLRVDLKGKCPKWSPEGYQKLKDIAHNKHFSPESRKKMSYHAKRRVHLRTPNGRFASESCADQPPQSTGHQTS